MKKIFKNVLMFGGLLTMMAACSNDVDAPVQKGNTPLQVKVMADSPNSRAIVHGEVFPEASQIGLTLVDESEATYDGTAYGNLLYETADGMSWSLGSSLSVPMLSATEGKAVAYFPWKDKAVYTALDVETGSQTDYMYSGEWTSGLSNSTPEVTFEMKHALAAFRVYFSKDAAYVADATVTNVKITSDAFVAAAKLNALTGELSNNTATEAIATSVEAAHVLDTDGKPADDSDAGQFSELIVVPADAKGTVLKFTINVADAEGNEKRYSTEITPLTTAMAQGSIYEYSLKLSATGFSVSEVKVKEWTPVENAGSGTLKPETEA